MSRYRLGVLLTHPVQYYAPLFRALTERGDVDLTVYFAHRPSAAEQGWEFGVAFEWDTDLLGGYQHEWLTNRAAEPNASTFEGCDTPEIADVIASRRFDAFLVMGWHARSYWQAMRACWATGTPVMVRGDSHLLYEPRFKRLAKRVTYPWFVRRFAACLSVGTRATEYFRYYGAKRVVASPHFVDNDFFGRRAEELTPRRAELRAQWGIPADALVLGFVGKLIPRKRPLDVIEAVARCERREVHVLLAGDGALRQACQEAGARMGVPVHIAGFLNQSRISEAYVASDALVLPSSLETWGLVVNEAMASGRPAIVSDVVGCVPDLVADGRTGYRHPLGDVDALADRIGRLDDDRQLGAAMGQAARAHVARFDAAAACDGIAAATALAVGG